MDKEAIYKLLNERKIKYEKTEHIALFSMKDGGNLVLPHRDADAKNLFVRDDKKRNFYLITVRGDKRIDLKVFRKKYGLRPLSFASEPELLELLNLQPGSVSPFGLLNDKEHKVIWFIDEEFQTLSRLIGIHPNDNTATVWLNPQDLINLISETGTKWLLADFSDCLKENSNQ